MRLSRIVAKRRALLSTLFKPVEQPATGVRVWVLRENTKAIRTIAAATWPDHGICLRCCRNTILVGCCIHCGTDFAKHPAFPSPSLATLRGPILANAVRLILAYERKANAIPIR